MGFHLIQVVDELLWTKTEQNKSETLNKINMKHLYLMWLQQDENKIIAFLNTKEKMTWCCWVQTVDWIIPLQLDMQSLAGLQLFASFDLWLLACHANVRLCPFPSTHWALSAFTYNTSQA